MSREELLERCAELEVENVRLNLSLASIDQRDAIDERDAKKIIRRDVGAESDEDSEDDEMMVELMKKYGVSDLLLLSTSGLAPGPGRWPCSERQPQLLTECGQPVSRRGVPNIGSIR